MADLAWIVPTRGRPEAVARLDEAWSTTGAWEYADLVLVVDGDDPECGEYERRARHTHAMVWLAGPWRPMVPKLDRAAAELADEGYVALGFGGDDHLPRTPTWARAYLDALHELGTGIVYGNDRHRGEALPTQWAMTVDIVHTLGRMVPAPVEHLYCDDAILTLGRSADCIRYLPGVMVEHVHPAAGHGMWDAGYLHVNRAEQYARDHAAYRQWRDHGGLARDAALVRGLREAVVTGG